MLRLKVLRKLLLGFVLWAVTPTLAVFAHSVLAPDRVGAYDEVTSRSFAAEERQHHLYTAPQIIGSRHRVDVRPVMGLGEPEARTWYGLGPTQGAPRPAVVLLHEAGRDGRSMLDMWKDLAEREDIILLAPDARAARWSIITDGPLYLNAILQDAAKFHPVDADHIYLAGHSDGASQAVRIANLAAGPFKAVVVHSGHPLRMRMLPALTPVPIHSFVGENDQAYPIESSRAAMKHLAKAGHPTSLTVLPGHDEWYYDIGQSLAPLMWDRLRTSSDDVLVAETDTPTPTYPRKTPTQSAPDRASGAKWIRVAPSD